MEEMTTPKGIFDVQLSKSHLLRTEKLGERIKRLELIEEWVLRNRIEIQSALAQDLGKSSQEADITEVFPLLSEIRKNRRNLKRWAASVSYPSSLAFIGTSAEVQFEPKGRSLIIAPWNYPFMLTVGPMVSSLAAGNTVILKPSEFTTNTSALIKRMTGELFSSDLVCTFEGAAEMSKELLDLPFDCIFFTGSPQVGKLVMAAAAKNLASVTLELGGKSPTIVDETADIKDAAKKIAWGKWLNAGQTCVAPDYVFVHASLKEPFLKELSDQANKRFLSDNSYAKIVNEKHFDRLQQIKADSRLTKGHLYLNGSSQKESLNMEPSIYVDVPFDSRMMNEEIFGPLLPVISFFRLDEVIDYINSKPKPLALYLFSRSRKIQNRILAETSSGAVVINDCVLQVAHPSLPFGGVNHSGIGKSHGKHGFLAFSNEKAVLKQRTGPTVSQLLYPPYTSLKNRLIDVLIKYF